MYELDHVVSDHNIPVVGRTIFHLAVSFECQIPGLWQQPLFIFEPIFPKQLKYFYSQKVKYFFQPQHLGDSVCEVDMPRHLLTIIVDHPDVEERVDTWLIVCLAQWWQCLTSILLCPRHCRTLTTQVITDNHNFQLNTTLSCHNAEEQTLTIAGAVLWPDIIYFLAIIKLFSNVVKKLQHVSLFYHFLAVLNKSQIAIVKTLDYLKYNAIESKLKQIW